ncbi:hypothetical protein Sru01_24270 [Sphaerisporangium rufum]|uniref:Uncharacterized protein n=1 Tax=Sphaerisporangium rufum TaxID=1381558 RepID=A0A919V4N1_9ACTN|nr:hypothetical protein Sru01_24270 [Sphaerisporangium rufum]
MSLPAEKDRRTPPIDAGSKSRPEGRTAARVLRRCSSTPDVERVVVGRRIPQPRKGRGHVYALRPLTQTVVSALNADLTMKDLTEDIAASRYPSVAG